MMWIDLTLATFASLIVLYVPGFLLCRAVNFSRLPALACAPIFSTLLFVLLGVAFRIVGVTCAAWSLALSGVAISAVVYGIVFIVTRKSRASSTPLLAAQDESRAWKVIALYVGVSFLVTFVVFIMAIGSPDAFARNDDTSQHLSMVRGMLDTGTFSTLHMSPALDLGARGAFYPGAWHVLVAIIASLFGDAVTLATNAMTIAFVAFVFPAGLYMLFSRLFADRPHVVLAGSLFAVAFCGFPWGFLLWGQLFPNMVSWMFIPPALAMLVVIVDERGAMRRGVLITCLVLSLVSIAVAQPNGVFTFGILAVFWGVSRILFEPGCAHATLTRTRILGAVGLFVGACALWALIFAAPFMQAYAEYSWAAKSSLLKSIAKGLLFMFSERQGIEPALSVLVLLGVIYTCKNRRYLWMSVAFLAAFVFFVIDNSMNGLVKQVLTAFWYTDPNRTGAMAAFFAMPLATLGFAWLCEISRGQISHSQNPPGESRVSRVLPVAILAVVLAVCQFLPVHAQVGETDVYLGLVKTHREIKYRYSWDRVLTAEEDAFIKKVMETIPEGAMVINVPSDGSCWSYGVEGLNTYFRRSSNIGVGGKTASAAIRLHLKDVAVDEEVQQALAKYGACYLLVLDDKSGKNRTTTSHRYKKKNWKGIETITKKTPGFKLILSEGDMRLYEITAVE